MVPVARADSRATPNVLSSGAHVDGNCRLTMTVVKVRKPRDL